MFVGTAAKEDRSRMNICFVMAPEYKDFEADFLSLLLKEVWWVLRDTVL